MAARWLTDDEQRAWRALLEATQRLFGELGRDMENREGLSQPDYEILVRLSEADGDRLRMSDLAENTLFSRSRLSHAVDRLAAEGLVARVACESDRRGTYAQLTPAGRRKIEAAAPGHVALVRELVFDRLTPEQVAQLEALCLAIAGREA